MLIIHTFFDFKLFFDYYINILTRKFMLLANYQFTEFFKLMILHYS